MTQKRIENTIFGWVRFPLSALFCAHFKNRVDKPEMAYLCGFLLFVEVGISCIFAAVCGNKIGWSFHKVSTKSPVSLYVDIFRDIAHDFLFVFALDVRNLPVIVLIKHPVSFPAVNGFRGRPGHFDL